MPLGHPWKLGTLQSQDNLWVNGQHGGYSSSVVSDINRNAGERGNAPPTQQVRQAVGPVERATTRAQDGDRSYSSHLHSFSHQCEACGAKPKETPREPHLTWFYSKLAFVLDSSDLGHSNTRSQKLRISDLLPVA